MATIGITGMGGFIGFHLAKKLHGEGHDVVGFDSFNNYYDPMLKSNRASNLHEKTGITTQNVDLKNREELDHWMKKRYPDLIIHLAAYAGVRNSMDCPEDYIQNNVVGTHNLIESCKKYDID